MERHVRLQHRLVAAANGEGALAPVRRIGQADRIARARVLVEAALLQRAEEGFRHFATGDAGLALLEPRIGCFGHGTFGIEKLLRRRPQINGARQRGVVAPVAAAEFEKRAFIVVERAVIPGEVRRSGVKA